MHGRRLESTLFVAKIELALQIEDKFGVTLLDGDDRILDAVDLTQFVDHMVIGAAELASQREAVWSYAVTYLRSCVRPEKIGEVESGAFSDLLSSGLERIQ